MKPNERHDEGLDAEHAVLGEAQHQALEHLVAHGQARLPQDRAQVVAARLAAVTPVVLAERHLLQNHGELVQSTGGRAFENTRQK